jgi:hypothetical protein
MRTPIELPSCLLDAYRRLFPTLDFGEIEFFLDDELEGGVAAGKTYVSPGRTVIRILPSEYRPCSNGTFLLLAHELVHALQGKTAGVWWSHTAGWTCRFLHGQYGDTPQTEFNCLETEAKRYEGRLVAAFGSAAPCRCDPSPAAWGQSAFLPLPDPAFAPAAFDAAVARHPDIVMRAAGCPATRCLKGSLLQKVYGAGVMVVAAALSFGSYFWGVGQAAEAGTVVGAVITGLGAGAFASSVGASVGAILLSVITGALIGAFVLGFVGALVDWLLNLFGGGPSGGSLNIMFSTDQGQTFGNKVTFERSRQQPALAFTTAPDRLYVGWTGTDGQVNVFVAPDKAKAAFEKSGPCGPALATGAGKVFLGWKGTDQHPNALFSSGGTAFRGKFVSGGDGPSQGNVGVTFGRGMVYLSWIGPDNRIRLVHLRDADPLTEVPCPMHQLAMLTGHQGTPALAFTGDRLLVAWSGFDPPHKLHLMELEVAPDGTVPEQPQSASILHDWTNDTTGPALAYDAMLQRLYLAFTGADDSLWVISSTDGGRTFPRRLRVFDPGGSRHDTGPALAVHPDGTVAVAWIGTDGD